MIRKSRPRRKHDSLQVIAAWGERCFGPGWTNRPIWVLLRNPADGALSIEAIQPCDQTDVMLTLFPMSALAAEEMRRQVEFWWSNSRA